MSTIEETAGKVKDWVVEHKTDIIWYGAALGVGAVCGRAIGNTVSNAMKSAYNEGFQRGCANTAMWLATDNKDNPEVLSAVLDFTTKHTEHK